MARIFGIKDLDCARRQVTLSGGIPVRGTAKARQTAYNLISSSMSSSDLQLFQRCKSQYQFNSDSQRWKSLAATSHSGLINGKIHLDMTYRFVIPP